MVKVDELRTYSNQIIDHFLRVGEVVKYKHQYYLVEKDALNGPLTLTPITLDRNREVLTLE